MNKIFAVLKRSWRKYLVFVERGTPTATLPSDEAECQYCGHVFRGNYCPRCGQSRAVGAKAMTVARTFREAYPQLSNNYIRTLLQLIFRPGYMVRDYLRGHRVIYRSPLNALVITMSIMAICLGAYNVLTQHPEKTTLEEYVSSLRQDNSESPQVKENNKFVYEALSKLGLTKKTEELPRAQALFHTLVEKCMSQNVLTIFVLLPIMGLSSRLACRKLRFDGRKLTIVEHYIIFTYLTVPFTLFNPGYVVEFFYYIWSYRGIYGLSWPKATLHSMYMWLLTILFATLLYMIVLMFLFVVYALK